VCDGSPQRAGNCATLLDHIASQSTVRGLHSRSVMLRRSSLIALLFASITTGCAAAPSDEEATEEGSGAAMTGEAGFDLDDRIDRTIAEVPLRFRLDQDTPLPNNDGKSSMRSDRIGSLSSRLRCSIAAGTEGVLPARTLRGGPIALPTKIGTNWDLEPYFGRQPGVGHISMNCAMHLDDRDPPPTWRALKNALSPHIRCGDSGCRTRARRDPDGELP
jgi:hypothetical protein